jgi:hypothetical protein
MLVLSPIHTPGCAFKWLPQKRVVKKETGQAVNKTTWERSMQGIEYP